MASESHSGPVEDGNDTDEDKEQIESKEVAPMFGLLFSVAEAIEKMPEVVYKLQTEWWQIIRAWYPNMLQKVYCVPPVHFYAVNYKPKSDPPVYEEPYERFGFRMFLPVQGTNVVDDEAQQRVLRTIYSYAKKKERIMFVLSNVEFQNYLNKNYQFVDPNVKDYEKPQRNEDGEIDVLVIDKKDGIFILEVKATGYQHRFKTFDLEKKLAECVNPLMKVSKQLPKEKKLLKRLLHDLDPKCEIKIRTGFLMPNLERDLLSQAISKHHPVKQDLMKALKVDSEEKLLSCCLCSDEMPPKHSTVTDKTMTDDIFQKIDRYWETLKSITGEMTHPIDDNIYEQIVARFCGPLTTVKIFTEKTMPRVKLATVQCKGSRKKDKKEKTIIKEQFEVRTKAGAAREMARRFSELVLLTEQIELLQRPEDFVHIEGPPGTGKTLMLLLRILLWLDGNNLVYMLSLSPASRSIIHVLHEQVKIMLIAYKGEKEAAIIMKKKLRIFVLTRPQHTLDDRYFERRLHKWRSRAKLKDSDKNWGYPRKPTLPPVEVGSDKKVCLVLDETGMTGKGLEAFFKQVGECHRSQCFTSGDFTAGLTVWSASVEKCGRPEYARHPEQDQTSGKFGVYWKLTVPLRCPPSVQRALMLVQPCLNLKNVFGFQRSKVLPHPVNPNNPDDQFNQYHADGLPVHLIAHGSHKVADKEIWFCDECGENLAHFLKDTLKIGQDCEAPFGTDVPLLSKDVLIVATHKAFGKSLKIGKFFVPMRKNNLNVAVNTIREEGDAALPPDDIILVADITSVHGLERAVVVVIPEHPNPTPDEDQTDMSQNTESESEAMEVDQSASASAAEQGDASPDSSPVEGKEITQDGIADMEMSEPSPAVADGTSKEDSVSEDMKDRSPDNDDERGRTSPSDNQGEPDGCGDDYTWPYADCEAEKKIDAALQTLPDSAKRDLFYIGSRAVCQLILIHFGKD